MNRRSVLRAAGASIATAVAGCSELTPEAPEPDPPESSELRVSVENATNTAQTVEFVVRVTADTVTTVEAFSLADIPPGETRSAESRELQPGEYELDIQLPNEFQSSVDWTSGECPVKDVEIQVRTDGFRIRDGCPDA